jgi:cell division transport system permease protein
MWTSIKRIAKSGFVNFWRNGFVSLASLSVMTVTLLVIGVTIFFSALLNSSLLQLKNKVDINVYFVTSAPESDILAFKKDIEALPEVKSVEYLSREDVLQQFKEKHTDDELILQAFDQLGDNPLGATFNINAKDPSQYESITKFIEDKTTNAVGSASIVRKVSYHGDKKEAIDSLSNFISSSKRIGSLIISLFIFISVLITFNTIQLVIYSSREEISVMRLVGASTTYIRGPFMITGLMYGLLAGIISMLLLYGVALYIGPATTLFFGGVNLATYYLQHFAMVFAIIVGGGIGLGAVSSFLAVRRYLTI